MIRVQAPRRYFSNPQAFFKTVLETYIPYIPKTCNKSFLKPKAPTPRTGYRFSGRLWIYKVLNVLFLSGIWQPSCIEGILIGAEYPNPKKGNLLYVVGFYIAEK